MVFCRFFSWSFFISFRASCDSCSDLPFVITARLRCRVGLNGFGRKQFSVILNPDSVVKIVSNVNPLTPASLALWRPRPSRYWKEERSFIGRMRARYWKSRNWFQSSISLRNVLTPSEAMARWVAAYISVKDEHLECWRSIYCPEGAFCVGRVKNRCSCVRPSCVMLDARN